MQWTAHLRPAGIALRFLVLGLYLFATNQGLWQRIEVLLNRDSLIYLYAFAFVWALSIVALIIVCFHPNMRVRLIWSLPIGLSTGVAVAFQHASQSELGIMDVLSLWNARHEASRAFAFYSSTFYWTAGVFLLSLLVIAAPPALSFPLKGKRLTLAKYSPVVPILLITAMLFAKDGGGTAGLPVQFAPLSIGMAAGWTLTTHLPPPRSAVVWKPDMPKVKHIVLLVDESVRGDYIDLNQQNPYTPSLAAHGSRVIDFGPAASGGNCSHYSNAILRFVGTPPTIGRDLFSHPTIWQFAKQADYRTVFIDAQAGFMRNKGQMQNFMTLKEMKDIDSYQAIDSSVPAQALDDALLDALIKELQSSEPVFVYANKNGAHFPYDRNYPESESKFRPTMSEAGDALATRVNSYRNAIWWTVDRFFDRLFRTLTLDNTVILYTSDHGQVLRPGRFSHCSIDDPDPREALVPLFVATDSEALRLQFQGGAALNRGRASHFSITPTALELMGYARADISQLQGISLLQPSASAARFTTGDIFGLFTRKTRWHDIDLHASYLEPSSPPRTISK